MSTVQLAGLVTGSVSLDGCDTVAQLCERINALRGACLCKSPLSKPALCTGYAGAHAEVSEHLLANKQRHTAQARVQTLQNA